MSIEQIGFGGKCHFKPGSIFQIFARCGQDVNTQFKSLREGHGGLKFPSCRRNTINRERPRRANMDFNSAFAGSTWNNLRHPNAYDPWYSRQAGWRVDSECWTGLMDSEPGEVGTRKGTHRVIPCTLPSFYSRILSPILSNSPKTFAKLL